MPGIVQVSQLLRDTPGYLDRCRAEYGRTFELRTPGIAPRLCFVTRPEDVEAVFAMSVHQASGRGNFVIKRLMGENSILFLEGDAHTRVKKILRASLERASASEESYKARARELVQGWSPGSTRYIVSDFMRLTLKLSFDLMFGPRSAVDRDVFADALRAFLRSVRVPRITDLDMGRYTPSWTHSGRRREIFRLINKEIEYQRSQQQRTGLAGALLDEADQGTVDNVPDHVLSLLITSFDTVAVTLAWAVYFVLADEELTKRVVSAARSHDNSDPIIRSVVMETARLRPVMPFFARTLTGETQLHDTTVAPGESIAVVPWITQRDPEVWTDPLRFDPERFNGTPPPRSRWMPFGGGARGCLGMSHALRMMPDVLEAIFGAADLRLAPGYEAQVVRRGFLMSPKGGVPVVVDAVR